MNDDTRPATGPPDEPPAEPISTARTHFSRLVVDAEYQGKTTVITRGATAKKVAVLMPYDEWVALRALRPDRADQHDPFPPL